MLLHNVGGIGFIAHERSRETMKMERLKKFTIEQSVDLACLTEVNKDWRVTKEDNTITIFNDQINVIFDKTQGRLTSYVFKGNELLKDGKGPKPNFWRAVTDNDFGNSMHLKNIEWKKASLFSKVTEMTYTQLKEGSVKLTIIYMLPGVETEYISTYYIQGDGVIEIENIYKFLDVGDIIFYSIIMHPNII